MPVTIPPFTDVPAPGDPVASAWAQQLTQFAVDQIVAQPGTPSSPNTELWYDTDDAGMSFPNVPRGFVGYDATSTAIPGIGSTLTYLAAQVQWVADPTRRYRTTLITGRIDQFTAQSNAFAGIYDGSNNAIRYSYTPIPPGGFGFIYTFAIESGLSGTVTRKAMGSTSAGTMNVQAYTMIMVEDIGSASQSGGGVWSDSYPRGLIGSAKSTTLQNQSVAATWFDLADLSIQWQADPTRRYRTFLLVPLRKYTAAGEVFIGINDGTNTQKNGAAATLAIGDVLTITTQCIESGLSGTQIRKGRAFTSSNGVTVDVNSMYQTYISVEDVGKA